MIPEFKLKVTDGIKELFIDEYGKSNGKFFIQNF